MGRVGHFGRSAWTHCAVLLVLSLLGSSAAAQDGVVAGALRISPSLTVDSGYDSNVYLQAEDEEPITALRFDIRPALSVRQVNPRTTDFRFDGNVNWRQFANYSGDDPRDQSGLFANLDGQLRINPQGFTSVLLGNRFVRSIEPWQDPAGDPFQVIRNDVRGEVAFHRGGYDRDGRSGLTGHLGVRHSAALYERFSQLDRQRFGADAELKWHFLPKTALFLDAQVDSLVFSNEQNALQESFANANGLPWAVGGGLSGLLLPRLSLFLRVGYADTNREEGASRGGVIGRAGLDVHLSEGQKISLAYSRDFSDGVLGNFVQYHRVVAGYDVGTRLVLFGLQGYFQRGEYGEVADTIVGGESALSTRNRVDDVVGARTSLGFHLGRFAMLGVAYSLDFRDSNFFVSGATDRVFLDPRYVRHVAQLSFTVRY